MVQVEKDERGNKGAALTTYVSLAGRYMVLMPTNPRGGGVSRRIEGEDRNELRDTWRSSNSRRHGPDHPHRRHRPQCRRIQWDLDYLLSVWKAIDGASSSQTGAFLIYQEGA